MRAPYCFFPPIVFDSDMPGTLALAAAVLVGVLTLYFLSGVLFGGGESKPVEEEVRDDTNFVERMASQVRRA